MKCFVCGNSKNFFLLNPELCKTNNYLCLNCGLVFIPKDKSYQKYYKQGGYFKESPNLSLRKELISRSLLISQAENYVKSLLCLYIINFYNKSVLDVGCAYGEILYYLKNKYHCKVLGIEPSKETAHLGEKMFNISITQNILEEFHTKEKFDIIICRHTLEHVDNPLLFLKKIGILLKEKGLLYLEVPNILKPSGGFSLDKFLYEEHLQTFSAYSLFKLLEISKLYTYEYSDYDFLKFFCGTQKKNRKKISIINSNEIICFLQKYKKCYNFFNYLNVYVNKFKYLLKLIYFKGYDIFKYINNKNKNV